jgi:hypothetical protein
MDDGESVLRAAVVFSLAKIGNKLCSIFVSIVASAKDNSIFSYFVHLKETVDGGAFF